MDRTQIIVRLGEIYRDPSVKFEYRKFLKELSLQIAYGGPPVKDAPATSNEEMTYRYLPNIFGCPKVVEVK